jgi:hypothetical protein
MALWCEQEATSTQDLKALLDQVADTRELVLRNPAPHGPGASVAFDAWSDAREEAGEDYWAWRSSEDPTLTRPTARRRNREDAAQDALAAT